MKILNLYAGIGGNRKLWKDVKVTAIELNPDIAKIYQDFFPDDKVIVTDAHQYLLDHYKEFDFIWSSPPCPTHSRLAILNKTRSDIRKYPDMALYQEIILLKGFANCSWVIENVISYYQPLIPPAVELHRHYFWSNFYIQKYKVADKRKHNGFDGKDIIYGFDLNGKNVKNKREILRNLVNPNVAAHILASAINAKNNQELKLAI